MTKRTKDPGIGSNYNRSSKRIINKDGSFNVIRHGGVSGIRDFYQSLIKISWWRFTLYVLVAYMAINACFALVYLTLGINNLDGGTALEGFDAFLHAFYFSCQTFTTVGYGAVAPHGAGANVVAAIEALTGLMSFAIITGLMYGRFSKPDARIGYSENMVIAPYRDGKGLMFRVVNKRDNTLMEMEVKVLMAISRKDDETGLLRDYYNLTLEIDAITFFPLPWTIVHPIDEDSPLANTTPDELIARNAELLIQIKGFDETFSQVVYNRHSYTAEEILFNSKFDQMFHAHDNGDVVVNIHKLSDTVSAED